MLADLITEAGFASRSCSLPVHRLFFCFFFNAAGRPPKPSDFDGEPSKNHVEILAQNLSKMEPKFAKFGDFFDSFLINFDEFPF